MSLGAKTPWHRTAHRLGGPDELDIGLHKSSQMGAAMGTGFLSNGFGLFGGTVYVPDRDGTPLMSGDTIGLYFSHSAARLTWMGVRAHIITGITTDVYEYTHPFESDPFNGSLQVVGTHGVTDPYPFSGGFIGFTSWAAINDDDGDVVTWTFPDTGAEAEQYAFDGSGVGHVGYRFHNFGNSRVVGNVTASSAGTPTEKQVCVNWIDGSGISVGASVGETVAVFVGGEVQDGKTLTLTSDVPEGSQLLLVAAAKAQTGFVPTPVEARPRILAGLPVDFLIPKVRIGTRYFALKDLIR